MTLKARIASGTFWVTLETWSTQAAQLGVFIVLSRLLGPEIYGLIALALIVTMLAEILIVGGGWGDVIAQRRTLSRIDEVSLFWFLLGLACALALAVAATAAPLGAVFDAPSIVPLIPWLALQLPLSALGVVPRALLRRELRFAPLAFRGVVSQLIAGALAIALALAGAGIWSLVALQIAQPAVDAAVVWSVTRWRPTAQFSWAAVRGLLPFVAGSLGDRMVVLLDNLAQRGLIGAALGPTALGFYAFARKILELLLQTVTRPLGRVLLPGATRARHDRAKLGNLFGGAAELAGLLVFPAAAGLAVTAPEAVLVVFGVAWLPAVPVLQALMVTAATGPFNQISATAIYASGATRWQLALSILALLTVLALLLSFGLRDIESAALALVLRSLLMLPVRLLVAQRVSGLALLRHCGRALPPLAAAAAMAAILLAARLALPEGLAPAARLAVLVPLGVVAYLAAARLLAGSALRGAVDFLQILRARRNGDAKHTES